MQKELSIALVQNDLICPNPSKDGTFNIKGKIGFVKNLQGSDVKYQIIGDRLLIEETGIFFVSINNKITKIINE